jgi:putative tryptophan/tyrosine transport system substrate-binding protein
MTGAWPRLTRRQIGQRASLLGLGLLAGCARLPFQAEPPKIPRVGYLGVRSLPAFEAAFRQGLREHGYVEDQTITVVWRYAEDSAQPLPTLAAELVHLPVDVLVTASNPAAIAAREASSTIPIVTMIGDPVASGLAASLARPGGNVTGLTSVPHQVSGKRLELLKETIPGLTQVGVLWPPYNPVKQAEWAELQVAGRTLGLHLLSLEVSGPDDFESAFAAASREQSEAMFVAGDNLTASAAPQIAALAARSQLPTIYESSRPFVDAGGLMVYGQSFPSMHRRAAYFVDKILKGAKPADLPIEQPRDFDFIINLATARSLGLTIPQHVLLQATEIINP